MQNFADAISGCGRGKQKWYDFIFEPQPHQLQNAEMQAQKIEIQLCGWKKRIPIGFISFLFYSLFLPLFRCY